MDEGTESDLITLSPLQSHFIPGTRPKTPFAPVELLVVVAIVSVGLLLPAISKVPPAETPPTARG